jgi:two-component system LytT family response regulator
MRTIEAIIVEDEKRSSDVLESLLSKYCPDIQIRSVEPTVQQAISAISQAAPDLVFLDVELPDASGFKVLESFPDKRFSVIFVTAYEHYAIKAIKACALDYLLKPVDIDDLISAVEKVRQEMGSLQVERRKEVFLDNHKQESVNKQRIALPTKDGLLFVKQEDIVRCKAEGNYTLFNLATKESVLISKPLNYFEEILDDQIFYRTHQSYLVNLTHVKKYVRGRGGHVLMSDDSIAEVSVRTKSELLEKFIK